MEEQQQNSNVAEQPPQPEPAKLDPAPGPESSSAPAKKSTRKKKTARKKKSPPKKNKTNGKPPILTAEVILAKDDLKEEELYVEEWEGTVWVRGLSSMDHEKLIQSAMEGPMGARRFNMVGYQAKMAVLCTYDGSMEDSGNRTFQDAHAPLLMKKASGPVAKIAQKAQELSGIGAEALKKLRENLGMTPSADSLSG